MVTREANMVVGHALNSLLCVVDLLSVHHCWNVTKYSIKQYVGPLQLGYFIFLNQYGTLLAKDSHVTGM